MEKPNIIYILADDMGYGDVSALNEHCGFRTEQIDQLAGEGMTFIDAHAASAVCTPSRYSILTGRYPWRSMLKKDVLQGYDPPLIERGRRTVAGFLKDQGYRTACIGKWHLGIEWPLDDPEDRTSVDFTKPFREGPVERGFEYFFGISASLDMPPYVYLENDHVTAQPDREESNWWEKGNSYNKQIFRPGPVGSDFRHEEVLGRILEKTMEKLGEWKEEPFFIYMPLTAPHTPILPTGEWVGKLGTTEYGDFVLMCDDVVGKINCWLKESGLEENTILIFTSDNGCSPRADYPELAQYFHNPSYIFRGTKFDIYEGGHRVPLVVKWKGHVAAGSVCRRMTGLIDFYATVADILGVPLGRREAEDSESAFPFWLGDQEASRHSCLVLHSVNGSLSIRDETWKLILCPDSGGKSSPLPGDVPAHFPLHQLYRMDEDVRERKNRILEEPQIEQRLWDILKRYMEGGHSAGRMDEFGEET